MGRFNHIQNSFASGELSRNLESRTDIKEYAHGAAIVKNMRILRHGGATKREGLVYGRSVHSANFDNLHIFNFRPGGLNFLIVIRPFNITGGTAAGFNDIPIIAYNLNDTSFLEPVSVILPTMANYVWNTYGFYETNLSITPGRWSSVHYGVNLILTHSSGEVAPLILSYRRESGADYIYVNHLIPAGYTAAVTAVEIPNDPGQILATGLRVPYQAPNTDISNTMTLSVVSPVGAVGIVTSVKDTFVAYKNTLTTGKYNIRPFYMHFEIGGNVLYICVYNFLTVRSANYIILNQVGTITPTTLASWRISHWGGNLGYPRFCNIFQERLIFAGSPAFPDTIWCSYAGNIFLFDARRLPEASTLDTQPKFFNYKGAKTTADPFDLAIASDEVSAITWVNTGTDIRVGTIDAEFAVGNVDQLFSDSNSFVKKVANIGGSVIPAVSAEGITMFISKDRKRLFSIEEGGTDTGYQTKNLSLLSSEILTKQSEEDYSAGASNYNTITISGMVWSRFESTLWMWTNINELIGLTYATDAATLAWHRHNFAPADLSIQNMAVAQNRYATEDNLWVLLKTKYGEYQLHYKPNYSNQIDMNNTSSSINDIPIFLNASHIGNPTNGLVQTYAPPVFFPTEDRMLVTMNHFYLLHKGHPVKFTTASATYLPAQLVPGTVYYASPVYFNYMPPITDTNTPYTGLASIKFSTTYANALAGVYIDLVAPTASGTVTLDSTILTSSPEYLKRPMYVDAGTVVSIVIDGKFVGTTTVDANQTISTPAGIPITRYVVYGIGYDAVLRTMDLNAGSQLESALESIERIDRVMILLYKSKDGEMGGKDKIYEDIEFDSTTLLETKKTTLLMPNGPDQETYVEVKSSNPLPLTVNGLVSRGTQHD